MHPDCTPSVGKLAAAVRTGWVAHRGTQRHRLTHPMVPAAAVRTGVGSSLIVHHRIINIILNQYHNAMAGPGATKGGCGARRSPASGREIQSPTAATGNFSAIGGVQRHEIQQCVLAFASYLILDISEEGCTGKSPGGQNVCQRAETSLVTSNPGDVQICLACAYMHICDHA